MFLQRLNKIDIDIYTLPSPHTNLQEYNIEKKSTRRAYIKMNGKDETHIKWKIFLNYGVFHISTLAHPNHIKTSLNCPHHNKRFTIT